MAPMPTPIPSTEALSMGSAPRAARTRDVAFGVDGVGFDQAAPVLVDAVHDLLKRFLNQQLFAAHEADGGVGIRLHALDEVGIHRGQLALDASDTDHGVRLSKARAELGNCGSK